MKRSRRASRPRRRALAKGARQTEWGEAKRRRDGRRHPKCPEKKERKREKGNEGRVGGRSLLILRSAPVQSTSAVALRTVGKKAQRNTFSLRRKGTAYNTTQHNEIQRHNKKQQRTNHHERDARLRAQSEVIRGPPPEKAGHALFCEDVRRARQGAPFVLRTRIRIHMRMRIRIAKGIIPSLLRGRRGLREAEENTTTRRRAHTEVPFPSAGTLWVDCG